MNSTLAQSRILIVDDDQTNVVLLTRVLQRAGYMQVRGLTDARAVLETRELWRPDVILLDLHMPHLDGVSLLRIFQTPKYGSDFIPVIILTADSSREAVTRALAAGANDYLTKPFDGDEVCLRVRNLLAIRHSHEGLKNSNATLAEELRNRVTSERAQEEQRRSRIDAIRALLDRPLDMAFQPVVDLGSGDIVGYEALARFDAATSPAHWFAEATALGLGTELELVAIKAALKRIGDIGRTQFLAVNASPTAVMDRRLHDLVQREGRGRVVIEITEHQPVDCYDSLGVVRNRLRRDGIRVAIDDAGAGYASLHHILKLAPDIIKLDISLTRSIDEDPVKRALAHSLVAFAEETNALVTAEGIETEGELTTLQGLGIPMGQGYLLGRPGPLANDQRQPQPQPQPLRVR